MEADERKCPRCAEIVKAEATVCRFCGFLPPRRYSEEEIENLDRRRTRKNAFVAGAVGIFAILLLFANYMNPQPVAPPRVVARENPAPCNEAMRVSSRERFVRRQNGHEIQVEDWMWSQMPADNKRSFMSLALCAYLGGRAAAGLDDYVEAYGYRSGQRLATAGAYGVELD